MSSGSASGSLPPGEVGQITLTPSVSGGCVCQSPLGDTYREHPSDSRGLGSLLFAPAPPQVHSAHPHPTGAPSPASTNPIARVRQPHRPRPPTPSPATTNPIARDHQPHRPRPPTPSPATTNPTARGHGPGSTVLHLATRNTDPVTPSARIASGSPERQTARHRRRVRNTRATRRPPPDAGYSATCEPMITVRSFGSP